jgi:plastocyanin
MPEDWHHGRHCPRDRWYFSQPLYMVPLCSIASKFGHMKRLVPMTAALLLVAACSSGSTSTPPNTVPAGSTVIKAVPGLLFDANQYGPIPAGDITFGYVNDDSIRHTLILAKGDTKVPNFKLEVRRKGDVDSGTVNLDAGTYTVICDVPGHGNMRATLTVE